MSILAPPCPDDFPHRLARLAGGFAGPRPDGRGRRCLLCRKARPAAELVKGVCPDCRPDESRRSA